MPPYSTTYFGSLEDRVGEQSRETPVVPEVWDKMEYLELLTEAGPSRGDPWDLRLRPGRRRQLGNAEPFRLAPLQKSRMELAVAKSAVFLPGSVQRMCQVVSLAKPTDKYVLAPPKCLGKCIT